MAWTVAQGLAGSAPSGFMDRTDPGLGGWVPGAQPAMFTEGIVSRLPKGSDFLLQVHFHPSGKAESEKSLIGIYFAENGGQKDLASVQLPAVFGLGAGIDIPPGEKQFTIKDSFTLPGDAKVYNAFAHAHYLAKQMKAEATLPDGSTRPLIWIRDWDFNWQDGYTLQEAVHPSQGHAHRRDADVRQLVGQPAKSDQPTAAGDLR